MPAIAYAPADAAERARFEAAHALLAVCKGGQVSSEELEALIGSKTSRAFSCLLARNSFLSFQEARFAVEGLGLRTR